MPHDSIIPAAARTPLPPCTLSDVGFHPPTDGFMGRSAAGLLGIMSGSVAVFVIAGALMIASSVYAGEIRGKGGRR